MAFRLEAKVGADKYEVTLCPQGNVLQVDHFKPLRGAVPWLRRNLFRANSGQDVIQWHTAKPSVQVAIRTAQLAQPKEIAA